MNTLPTLDELAIKYGTDKCSLVHNYTRYYEKYLESARNLPITLLEIGIQGGNSIRMWEEYFPNATIVGMDNKEHEHVYGPRVKVVIGDQGNQKHLMDMWKKCGPFDIVIDDGSHINKDLLISFDTLFPLLKPGGLYVAEDLHTCYWGRGFGKPVFIERVKQIIDFVNSGGKSGLADISKDYREGGYVRHMKPMTWWERSVEFMHNYRSIVFVKRYV